MCCLALAELEALACLRTAGLLALDGTCVAREETEVAKLATVILVDLDEGTRHGKAERAGLARLAAAVHVRLDVILAKPVRRREWLLDGRDERGTREVVAERAPVDVPLAASGFDVHAADGFLAASDRVRDLRIWHWLLRLGFREGQRLGLLRDVLVLGTGVDAELATEHLAAEGRLGEHAVNGL